MNTRAVAIVGGAGLTVLGLSLVLVPGLGEEMGVGQFFVLAAGVAAAALLVVDLRALALAEVDRATPPAVEEGVTHPRAGEAVDALLADAAQGYDRHTQERRDRVEARIREVAIDVLARREDRRPEAVEAMLVEGSWTDDPYAAAFLGAHEVEDLPLRERVADALRPEAQFARRATHAIHAIADLEAGDRDSGDSGPTDRDGDGPGPTDSDGDDPGPTDSEDAARNRTDGRPGEGENPDAGDADRGVADEEVAVR